MRVCTPSQVLENAYPVTKMACSRNQHPWDTREKSWFMSEGKCPLRSDNVCLAPRARQQSRGTVSPPQTWAEDSSSLPFALTSSRALYPSAGTSLRAWKAVTGLSRKWWWAPPHKTMSPGHHELAGHKSCLALSSPPLCHLLQTLGS